VKADVWTIESKHNGHSLLPSFERYKGKLEKKIAVGFISHRQLQVETAEEVADDVRLGLKYIESEHLILSSDCGFGRQGVPRPIALYKASALAQGANIVRAELGVETTQVPAARRSRSTYRLSPKSRRSSPLVEGASQRRPLFLQPSHTKSE
jgi:5-methyltetrahydropteroyltriglutamate--homocysteine methyltransferase